MPDTPAARRWRALVEEHAASGLTNAVFAAEKNVNPRTLAWWRSRLKREDAAIAAAQRPERSAFTELVVARSEPTVVLALEDLRAHVVVDHDTDLPLLKRVLAALC